MDDKSYLDEELENEMKAKRNEEYLAMIDKSIAEAEAGGFVVNEIPES